MVSIRHATVLGAGTIGAQIAAQLANAGVPVLLLDESASAAAAGLARARAARPPAFFLPEETAPIRTGGLEDLGESAGSDWIIEAVVERLDVKRQLMARLDGHLSSSAVVSTNTSGLSVADIAKGRSATFRRRWLGTHFFNPPRYLHLVELIPTPDTEPDVVQGLADFLDIRLGKGTVIAKDRPAFIANRIGLFGLVRLLDAAAEGDYSVEEIDAITGPVIGRPRSATFRTLDLAGLDVLAMVAADLRQWLPPEEGAAFRLPLFVDELLRRRWLGEKSGQGFYRRVRAGNASAILSLDIPALLAGHPDPYRAAQPPAVPSLQTVRDIPDVGTRIHSLFAADDRAGALLRRAVRPALEYAMRVAPDVAFAEDDVDRAMQWGFGWELGPREMLNAIADRRPRRRPPPARAGFLVLRAAREAGRTVRHGTAADIVDLGDGVFCVEFHSKMNTIGRDTLDVLLAGLEYAAAHGAGLVVGGESDLFSAGADLRPLLAAAEAGHWDDIDRMVRTFQRVSMAIKTAPIPVVAATRGLTLGGGCEICLHADRVQAAAETYMGLVETRVGLIPAGGGTKELAIRTEGDATAVQRAFESIALAVVSTSAPHAKQLRYLRGEDAITMNHQRLIADAKAAVLVRARAGRTPPAARSDVRAAGPAVFERLSAGVQQQQQAGRLGGHGAIVARKLAWVLTGGDGARAGAVSEDQLLDLEREVFLSLCGEPETIARIGEMLRGGRAG